MAMSILPEVIGQQRSDCDLGERSRPGNALFCCCGLKRIVGRSDKSCRLLSGSCGSLVWVAANPCWSAGGFHRIKRQTWTGSSIIAPMQVPRRHPLIKFTRVTMNEKIVGQGAISPWVKGRSGRRHLARSRVTLVAQ